MSQLARNVFGLPIPDGGALFDAALACHMAAGLAWHLLVIGTVAFGTGTLGYLARRHRRPGWLRVHIPAMGGAYIALFTGFYVDNGPHLPLWDQLPGLAYWLAPSLVGVPLILRALARRRLLRVGSASRGRPGSGVQPGRPG